MRKIIKKHKKIIGYICLFVFTFVVCFFYSCFLSPVAHDEIWNYGFSYNIASGLVPYRDFNMLQTPLFFFIGSIFIKIFGNYLFSLHIFDALLVAGMMLMLFKSIGWKSFIILPLYILFCFPSYNLLSLFWLNVILYLVYHKKDHNILVGLIIGLSFLTKQNIGLCLFIPYFIFSKDKFKSILMFCIPFLFLLIYLIYNQALYNFIDYCFLGLFDFNQNNKLFDSILLIFEMVIIFYLCRCLYKSKFKDVGIMYIFMFQVIVYPICNTQHFFIALLPVLYLILKHTESIFISYGMLILVICYFGILSLSFYYTFTTHKEKSDFLYLRNIDIKDKLEMEQKLILKYHNKNYFLIFEDAYLRKLYMKEKINKYDFMSNGNMGYHGGEKYVTEINDICSRKNCLFFVDETILEHENTQFNKQIYHYVLDNYKKIDSKDYIGVYANEK